MEVREPPGAVVNTELLPPSRFCPASTEMKAWSRRRKRRMEHGSQPKWRATADEDGHYSFSLRRGAMVKCDSPPPISRTQPPAADATGHLIVSPFAAGQDVVADAGGPTAAADMQRRRDRERSPRPTLRVPMFLLRGHVFTSRDCRRRRFRDEIAVADGPGLRRVRCSHCFQNSWCSRNLLRF